MSTASSLFRKKSAYLGGWEVGDSFDRSHVSVSWHHREYAAGVWVDIQRQVGQAREPQHPGRFVANALRRELRMLDCMVLGYHDRIAGRPPRAVEGGEL